MSYHKGRDHDGLLEGFTVKRVNQLRAAEIALEKALDKYLERAHEFRASPIFANRLSDLVPKTFPPTKGAHSVLNIFGIPVRLDAEIPPNEIRVFSKSGDRVAAVTIQL